MAKPDTKSAPSWRGDFLGALTAGMVSLPVEANYGVIALAPLGPSYIAMGILAALYCAVFANLAGLLTGSRTGLLGGTRPTLVLAVAALITELSARVRSVDGPDVPLIMAYLMLTLFMAGSFQVLMGVARIGRIVKYLPYPVLAGFVNGAAILIFLSALQPLVGVPNGASLAGFARDLAAVKPATLAVGFTTLIVALWLPRFTTRIPSLLVAIIAGTSLHYLLALFLAPAQLSGTLGLVAFQMPGVDALRGFSRIFNDRDLLAQVPSLVPPALTLALLATVETLLTASVVDGLLHTRHQSDRELLAQGAANVLASCFGGLPSAAGVGRCANNVRMGARTQLASAIYILIAIMFLLGVQLIGYLPLAMTGGIIVAVAFSMIDQWSRRVPRQLLLRHGLTKAQRHSLLANYLVMLLVVAMAVFTNLITAVFFGVLAAMFLFVRRNSVGLIRRELHGDRHHSLRQRSIARMRELEREGWRIVLLELEGALFFGTADQLAREAERIAVKADYLILDFRRVTEIDVTGARILQQSAQKIAAQRCQLLLASIQPEGGRGRMLTASGIDGLSDHRFWFQSADFAMEWAENALLQKFELAEPTARVLDVCETQLGRGVKGEHLAVLQAAVSELHFARGAPIFCSGDPADGLYVVVFGSVSVVLGDQHRGKRVASFAPGVVFGELGLLDGGPRAADVRADEAVTVLKLSRNAFEHIREAQPELAAKILFNLGVEMATRLRYTNRELQEESV